jgi:hypothetical protein
MFLDTNTDERITQWRTFRDTLEECVDPYKASLDFWKTAPVTDKYLNPFNSQQWPTPWELIKENRYCPVGIPLMIGHTLKLTTRFTKTSVLIKIYIDHTTKRYYNLVKVCDNIIDYENNNICISSELSDSMVCQETIEL